MASIEVNVAFVGFIGVIIIVSSPSLKIESSIPVIVVVAEEVPAGILIILEEIL